MKKVLVVALVVAALLGCKGKSGGGDDPKDEAKPSGPAKANPPKQPASSLGMTTKQFRERWNAQVEKLTEGNLANMKLPEPRYSKPNEWSATLDGVVVAVREVPETKELRRVALVQDKEGSPLGMALASNILVEVIKPGTPFQEVTKDLGMVKGTVVSTTRGDVRFTFAQTAETNDDEMIVATLVADPPPASAPAQATAAVTAPPPPVEAPGPSVADLKKKIRFEEAGEHEDDSCTAMGAPGYALRFKGGTYDEMNSVASAMHCTPRYNSGVNRVFCCPPK
jgi:hypothetical protein